MKKEKELGSKLFDVCNILFCTLLTFVCIYPFYYVLINTISDNNKVALGQIIFFPEGIHFENYISVFRLRGIGSAALTSVLRTVLGTLTATISAAFVGYVMTKKEFWHRKFWYRFFVITMYFSAGLIPGYVNMKNLGLINNFWVYVLPALICPYNMILVKTYIESLPPSLEEAAVIDGAGYLTRFFRLIVPLSKPILATVGIFSAVGQWNSYMDTILYMTGGKYQTLQALLYKYLNQVNAIADIIKKSGMVDASMVNTVSPVTIRYTITAITVLPILFVYPFFQRYFVSGIMIGAVKE